jgi:hypothetical protein
LLLANEHNFFGLGENKLLPSLLLATEEARFPHSSYSADSKRYILSSRWFSDIKLRAFATVRDFLKCGTQQ